MKVLIEKTPLHSYTLQHLLGCLETISIMMDTEDWPFTNAEHLATELETWRQEFQITNKGLISSEPVLILLYGENVILIANQKTGEYLLFTYITESHDR
jgi:hypothetical protein